MNITILQQLIISLCELTLLMGIAKVVSLIVNIQPDYCKIAKKA